MKLYTNDIFRIAIVFAILAVLTYIFVKTKRINNFLSNRYGHGFFTGWRILHIFTYFLLYILFPEYWVIFIVIGFLWEVIETWLLGGCFSDHADCKKWATDHKNLIKQFSYDVGANCLGMFIGYIVTLLIY